MDFSRRFEVLEEIVKTEQSYVNFLERLVKIFILPIRALVGTPEQLLNADDIKVLFANVEIIYQFNYELSAQLRTRMNNKRASFQLGDIFVKMTPYFKMYAEYLRNYDQSQALLLRLQAKNKEFKNFMEVQRNKHKEHMQLRDLLIMPVQRIPRYRLLLEELMKQTPGSNMDYQNIKEALQAIVEVADEVNKDIEEHERMNKIVAIENRLSNPPDNLVAPHRKFIREATFTRIEKHRKKELSFFLFNDVLVFAQQGNLSSFASAFKLGSKKLKVKIVCSLHAVSVLDIPESDDLNGHFFQFCISPQKKMLYFQSKTVEEKASWIVSVVEAIADYNNKMNERMDNIQRADSMPIIELVKSDSASESSTPINSPGPASPNVPPNNSNSTDSSPKSVRKSGSHKKKRTSGSHKERDKKDKIKSDRPPSINEESISESSVEVGNNNNNTNGNGMSVTIKPTPKDEDKEAGMLFEKLSLRASIMVNPADLHKFVARENLKSGIKRPYETLRPVSPNRQSGPDRSQIGRMPSPSLAPNPNLFTNTTPNPVPPTNNNNNTATGAPSPIARAPSKANLKSPQPSPNSTPETTSPSITKKPSDPSLNANQITKKPSDPALNTGAVTKKPSDPALNVGQVNSGTDGTANKSTPPTTPRRPSDPAVAANAVTSPGSRRPSDAGLPNNQSASPTPPVTPRRPSDPKLLANQITANTGAGPHSSPQLSGDAPKTPLVNVNGIKNSPIESPETSKPSSPREFAPLSGPQSAPPRPVRRISTQDLQTRDANNANSPTAPRESGGGPALNRPAAAGTRHPLEKPSPTAPNPKGLAAPAKKRPMANSHGPPNGQQKQPPMLRNPSTGQLNGPKLPPRPAPKKVTE